MNALSTLRLVPALACAALLCACGAAPPPEPPPSPPVPPPPAEGEAPADAMMDEDEPEKAAPAKPQWGGMNPDQQKDYMQAVVVPKMGASFKGFDAKRFAGTNCMTCHGPKAKDGKFAMPNAALPKLPKDGKFDKLDAKMTAFMKTKVVPEMAGLLSAKPYDPATKQGFGCFACHTPKE